MRNEEDSWSFFLVWAVIVACVLALVVAYPNIKQRSQEMTEEWR